MVGVRVDVADDLAVADAVGRKGGSFDKLAGTRGGDVEGRRAEEQLDEDWAIRELFAGNFAGLSVVPQRVECARSRKAPTAATVTTAARARSERQAELQEQAGAVAATAAAYLTQFLSAFDSMAAVLARHPAVVSLDRARCDELFPPILRQQPLLLNIVLSDTKGMVRGSGLRTPAGGAPTVVEMPYVQDVASSAGPVVGELTTGRVSGKPTVVLAYPVFDEHGTVIGTLGLGVNLARLESVFGSIPLPEGSVITVTDYASRVLARSRESERYIGTLAEARAVPPSEVAPMRVRVGLDGVPRFYGNATIDRGPWVLSVGIPTSVAASRLAPLWRRTFRAASTSISCAATA